MKHSHDAESPRWLIAGLGNVGAKYAGTRHNVGFDVLDSFADALGLSFGPARGDYFVASNLKKDEAAPSLFSRLFGLFGAKRRNADELGESESLPAVVLIKPTTFMNRSGLAIEQALRRYGLSAERILVVCDDLNLPLGAVRIRAGGSDGGHNGLRSIIETLGTTDFPRMRLGVGPRPAGEEIVSFVLGRFSQHDEPKRQGAVRHAVAALDFLLRESSDNSLAMAASRYNIIRPDPAPGSGGTGE